MVKVPLPNWLTTRSELAVPTQRDPPPIEKEPAPSTKIPPLVRFKEPAVSAKVPPLESLRVLTSVPAARVSSAPEAREPLTVAEPLVVVRVVEVEPLKVPPAAVLAVAKL